MEFNNNSEISTLELYKARCLQLENKITFQNAHTATHHLRVAALEAKIKVLLEWHKIILEQEQRKEDTSSSSLELAMKCAKVYDQVQSLKSQQNRRFPMTTVAVTNTMKREGHYPSTAAAQKKKIIYLLKAACEQLERARADGYQLKLQVSEQKYS